MPYPERDIYDEGEGGVATMAPPALPPVLTEGTPGTMTTQFQGESQPTTRLVPHVAPQPLPSWLIDYDRERKAFLDERRAQDEAWQMAQRMAANKEMEVAYTKAMQLEGQLGFAADVKAGVPMPQALSKWAPKMYWNNPSQSERAMEAVMKANEPAFRPTETTVGGTRLIQTSPNRFQIPPIGPSTDTGPIEARPVMVGGQQVGSAVPGQRGAVHVIPQPREPRGLTASERISAIRLEMEALDKEIDNERDRAVIAQLQAKKNELRKELSAIRTEPAKSKSAPKVGEVISGYRYKGGPPSKKESWEKVQ